MPESNFSSKVNHYKKVAGSFTIIFQGLWLSLSNLFHDFWEDCSYKPKHLLVASRRIYLNISISIDSPRPPGVTVFYISIATSGETTSRCLFQHGKLYEKNYNL